jgi:hypothetical protein
VRVGGGWMRLRDFLLKYAPDADVPEFKHTDNNALDSSNWGKMDLGLGKKKPLAREFNGKIMIVGD